MAGDLGADAIQVHAREVLDFWFGLTTEQQFMRDDALDRQIAERFGALRETVLATRAEGWRDHPDTMLAAIILLDQFSRNLFRRQAEAFAADDLAAGLTLEAIDRGYDSRLPPERRVFLYMPLMHAEDGPLQDRSVALFEALGIEENAAYARDHRDVFRRFGRFPGRNAALGRETTAEEQAWLEETGGGW
ncbi:DUF924 family protein [Sphingomonas sp. KR1UV-12]|uniref:DUF924 family protein n=1 Tax=Sphingomonas aurea TaxID=3063994 RepID=A0ABT9EGM2_9SPHN|nr:DUF924 family protein [Sphingomonas sp. KR1UV-12]MDP1026044.1 DUF924 family protein [Sphingomonas sp. KR1UV-12]